MEPKSMLISALGLGLGVGVGLGLAGSQTLGKWAAPLQAAGLTSDMIGEELMRLVTDGKESKVTFDDFPYYLSEQTRVVLSSAAFVHLKQAELSKFTRNLLPASRAILLSGPTELYQQMLAKALAHYFESNLLLLDVSDFALKVQSKYGFANKNFDFRRSISESTLKRLTNIIGSFSILPQEKPKGAFSAPPVQLKRTTNWTFDEKLLIQELYKLLVSVSKNNPIVLYIRDVEGLVFRSQRIHSMFQKMLKSLTGPILILGSRIVESNTNYGEVDERLNILFPYNVEIKPPQDENHLVSWKSQLKEDMKMMVSQDNKNHILEVLASNDLDCNDLGSICLTDAMVIGNYIEEIVVSAVSYHLMHNKDVEYINGKLVISSKSLSHVLSIFQGNKLGDKDSLKLETNTDAKKVDNSESANIKKPETKSNGTSESKSKSEKLGAAKNVGGLPPKPPEVPPDNKFETRIRSDVIPASQIEVTFDDIGALDDIKETLHELVMLPLRRPELFKGGLLKPCRGILLFGPPGTGKTMLAKAIANEAGASFINVSMSTISSKWFGEDEKIVKALFTLAAKISPTIIFVDEVDSMLGQRSKSGENEEMRKIKNEFMTRWDGLLTGHREKILVLGATNRPFDLDEAIVRRFERRIMIGMPSVESRELILKAILSKEKVEGRIEYKELAAMTEGYSGSDLKNLCTTAAYRPLRDLIKQEKQRELEIKQLDEETDLWLKSIKQEDLYRKPPIVLRPLNMEDIRQAKNQIERGGKDITITAFSNMVGYSLQAAEILSKHGISAEVEDIVRAAKRACYRLVP